MKSTWQRGSVIAMAALMAACGGNNDNFTAAPPVAPQSVPHFVNQVSITGLAANANYGFDLGITSGSKYYFTDRNNAAVQVIDIPTLTNTGKIIGVGSTVFAGAGVDNSHSGPDGLNQVGSLLYAGDVNSVKIIDPVSSVVIKNIPVSSTGVRADEGCVDSVHHLYVIASPEEAVPFLTVIDTTLQAVVGKVTFLDHQGNPSAGLEGCRYDAAGDTFYINNDGSTDNPHGELVKMPGASIRAIPSGTTVNYTALAGVGLFNEGNCDPTGLALGPNTDLAVNCREGTTGAPLLMQIINRSTGAVVASLNAGGGDQLEYDPTTNRYYSAASRWTASGLAATGGACSTASPCTPVLTIVDAATRTLVKQLPSGNNAHSVAVDPATGYIFMPFSSATSPAGCGSCVTNAFTNAGVAVFKTQ